MLKFLKYFIVIIAIYLLILSAYHIHHSPIENHFFIFIVAFLFCTYWLAISFYSPKKAPFFKFSKKRVPVLIFGILLLLAVVGVFTCYELFVIKRIPQEGVYINVKKSLKYMNLNEDVADEMQEEVYELMRNIKNKMENTNQEKKLPEIEKFNEDIEIPEIIEIK